jgi:hypothetical protein
VAIVLAEDSRAVASVARNEVAGQRAEAFFVRVGGTAQLALDLRDNVVADATGVSSEPLPAVLLESRDGSRVCASLSNNRIGDGPGGGPALLVRQLDHSVLTLVGQQPPDAAPLLAADNRLGRVEVEAAPAEAGPEQPATPPSCPEPPRPPPLSG